MPLEFRSKKFRFGLTLGAVLGSATLLLDHRLASLLLEHTNIRVLGFLVPFLVPGMLVAVMLSGNVHAFPMWIAALANAILYYSIVQIVWSTRLIFRRKA
jgi:hypothetical protein